jgi:hypothetical protein
LGILFYFILFLFSSCLAIENLQNRPFLLIKEISSKKKVFLTAKFNQNEKKRKKKKLFLGLSIAISEKEK